MNPETILQNEIMTALCRIGCYVERSNSGLYYTKDGRAVKIGVRGQSDLRGHTKTGRAFYLEVKTKSGTPTKEQLRFIEAMRKSGAIAGVVRNVDDAIGLLHK